MCLSSEYLIYSVAAIKNPLEVIQVKNNIQANMDKITWSFGFFININETIITRNNNNHSKTGSIIPKKTGYKSIPQTTASERVRKNLDLF